MVFAGHPTIGTSYVLLEEGIVPKGGAQFMLEEKVGPVPIRVQAGARPLIWLTTPPIRYGRHYDASLAAKVLGLDEKDLFPGCSHPSTELSKIRRPEARPDRLPLL